MALNSLHVVMGESSPKLLEYLIDHIKPKRYEKGHSAGEELGSGRRSGKVGLVHTCTCGSHSGRSSKSSSKRLCLKKSLVSPYVEVTMSDVVMIAPINFSRPPSASGSSCAKTSKSRVPDSIHPLVIVVR